ncbi:hypothetical protein ABT247_29175, partial [Kitasatospora sp. NPDC001539]|uniref:hypothetical protein n=1 Tax=Kitasatospora sp. NPDC001539 TaxID=3154384 RepID=UPI0033297538
SWNNKQAAGYTAAGFGNGSVHRANLLDDRVKGRPVRVLPALCCGSSVPVSMGSLTAPTPILGLARAVPGRDGQDDRALLKIG